jgi:hypothetical protein
MQISLDAERWTVGDGTTLLEALAQVSNKARGRGRIVTTLKIGGRLCTDRDLLPEFLARTAREAGSIEAVSTATADILAGAKDTISQFGLLLRREGESMVRHLRTGTAQLSALDTWLGQLAEYMEITERAAEQGVPGFGRDTLVPWAEQLVDARRVPDTVRMADVLEYEILPRISRSHAAT